MLTRSDDSLAASTANDQSVYPTCGLDIHLIDLSGVHIVQWGSGHDELVEFL